MPDSEIAGLTEDLTPDATDNVYAQNAAGDTDKRVPFSAFPISDDTQDALDTEETARLAGDRLVPVDVTANRDVVASDMGKQLRCTGDVTALTIPDDQPPSDFPVGSWFEVRPAASDVVVSGPGVSDTVYENTVARFARFAENAWSVLKYLTTEIQENVYLRGADLNLDSGSVSVDEGDVYVGGRVRAGGATGDGTVGFGLWSPDGSQAEILATDDDTLTVNGDLLAKSEELTAHIDDTSDAHDASAILFAPGSGIAATDVQAAIEEAKNDATAYTDTEIADLDALTVAAPLRLNPSPPAGTQEIQALGMYANLASLTGTTVNGTTSETAITTANYTAPANQFAPGDMILWRVWGTYLKNTGGSETATLRIRAGGASGTVIFTQQVPSLTDNATAHAFHLEHFTRITGASGFNGMGRISIAATTPVSDEFAKTVRILGGTSVTLSNSLEIVFTVQNSGSSANQSWVIDGAQIFHAKALA